MTSGSGREAPCIFGIAGHDCGRTLRLPSRGCCISGGASEETFAFETTLASKSYLRWLRQARASGYKVGILVLSLTSPEAALERVARRVLGGGHDVPEPVVRRRFDRGLRNFFQLYQPLADQWFFTDNSGRRTVLLVHGGSQRTTVEKSPVYRRLKEQYGSG